MKTTITKTRIKKDQIHKAAWNCFVQYGFDKTTMDDIAASVGMKKASLYYYYENKEAIFREVIEEEVNLSIIETKKILLTKKTSTDKLFSVFNAKLEFFHDKAITLDLSVKLLVGARSIMYKLHKKILDQDISLITKIIQEGIKNGEFKDCDPYQVAEILHTLVESLSFIELQSADVQSIADIDFIKFKNRVNYTLDIFIHGIIA